MDERPEPSLRDCLAYAVLEDHESWLGAPSPSCLSTLLAGAAARAALVGRAMPTWRVYGPLETRAFYLPLVARTGHPTLSIKWATAMELHHFSLAEAMRELAALIRTWVERHGLDEEDELVSGFADRRAGLDGHLSALARRPGMFLGQTSGWMLRCYLTGMDRGGDWLGLPALSRLRAVVDGIERRSEESYGSKFAAYRVYEQEPAELLAWVGIVPT